MSLNNNESQKIVSGYSHCFDVGIAKKLGVQAAVVYQHIQYWVNTNRAKNKGFHDGRFWMYETIKEMADFFEYLTERQIRYAIYALCEAGLIEKSHHASNKFDRVTWYTIWQMHVTNLANASYTVVKSDVTNLANVYIRNKDKEKEEQKEHLAHTTSAPPSSIRKKASQIDFSFEERKFLNILEIDLQSWKEAYPCVDIKQQLAKMVEWCLSNEKKARSRSQWRKFITSWLGKANEEKTRQEAYKCEIRPKKSGDGIQNADQRKNPRFIPIDENSSGGW